MSLYHSLQQARSEEDVKDAYIKALKLKSYAKNLIDIQTKEIWFEAKEKPTSPVAMFSQLLSYVKVANKKGELIPPFLAVFDREKAALMETTNALPLFKDKTIEWSTAASHVSKETIRKVQPYIEAHFVVYKIETHEDEFIQAVSTAIKEGKFIRTSITPDNLKQVFDKWVNLIGNELTGVSEVDYALIFFADIMHDGQNSTIKNLPARLIHDGNSPVFMLHDKIFELSSLNGYRRFWAIYHRPPNKEYREYLLERRDSLLPIDERIFKGAYYTPLKVVDKAYDFLTKTLGKNWQKKYIVWDMCCGVGNLEVKHSNHRNIFMSTLDKADIDVMKASQTCISATQFQYDYLNDDIDDYGNIDYSITNKLPKNLRQYIIDSTKKNEKKILVLINPPYAEATNAENISSNTNSQIKSGVSKTKVSSTIMADYGKSSNELFTQFIARIQKEIPNAILAIFSKLKYVNAPNFELFREKWKAHYLDGFIVHSKAFDGIKGDFPIGFLIWDTGKKESINKITTTAYNKNSEWVGEKSYYNLPNNIFLNNWLSRPKSNKETVVPLSNAVTVRETEPRVSTWSDGAIAYMCCAGNDMYNSSTLTFLCSSAVGRGDGFYVTPDNLWKAAVIFTVRKIVKRTWMNDRDQLLQPDTELSQEFIDDCLIWMLFNGSNLTASADNLKWNDQSWSIINHFIPYSEKSVNANGRFESSFMFDYLKRKKISIEAKAVISEGLKVWRHYFSISCNKKTKNELKLNRPDIGWYQVRKAIELTEKEEGIEFDFYEFKNAYNNLGVKLQPMIFEYGFLK